MKRSRAAFVSLLCLIVLAALMSSASAVSPIPQFSNKWGSEGTAENQLSTPWGVATDSAGNVYVTEISNRRVQVFDANGTFLRMWGWGVAGADAFQVCTSSCQAGVSGLEDGAFSSPFGIAIDPSDNIYVVDSGNARIQKFGAAGNFIKAWGSYGSAEGQFDSVRGIAANDAGHVFVTEAQNNRVQEFDPDGNFVRMWGWGVDDGTDAFQVCTSTCQSGVAGSGDGQLDYPSPIAVAPDGSIYVGSINSHLVTRFDSTGDFISDFGGLGVGDGLFNIPEGIAVNSKGNVFVSDYSNHRIQKFGPTGNFLANWGSLGTGDGQFSYPQGLAFGLDGDLFIAESTNHRVQVFGRPDTSLIIKAPSSVRKGTVATVRGKLESVDPGCVASQKVILARPDKKRLASGKTTATGAYALKARLFAKTRVMVQFVGDVECGPSQSAIRTIKVT